MPKRRRKQQTLERMKWLTDYKEGKPCADCGKIFDPICMDFHHREPHLKKDEVRQLLRDGYSMTTVMHEIDKCDILCACCHRLRHKDEPHSELAHEVVPRGVLPL